jgi:hypothetical protein
VLLFALVVSVSTGLLFGLAPAWQSAHTDVVRSLSDDTRSAGHARRGATVRTVLTISQVAL